MQESFASDCVLLVDDDPKLLKAFATELSGLLPDVRIISWQPTADEGSARGTFYKHLADDTTMVVTDYDLTGGGMKGLFAPAIVDWCQQRAIPVGNFTRSTTFELPSSPNLFELRVPTTTREGTRYIARALRGFSRIREKLATTPATLMSERSLAATLARLLERPRMESEFALYMSRLGTGNTALVRSLRELAGAQHQSRDRVRIVTYVLGHVLLNAVFRFPGPILTERALCAYVGTSDAESPDLLALFSGARYDGPFGEGNQLFWREDVDEALAEFGADHDLGEFESFSDYHRGVVERQLGRVLGPHECARCDGRRGGFLCPFTERTVCQRSDCSVAGSSWVPRGAQVCRVERDFFEEWAPILGL